MADLHSARSNYPSPTLKTLLLKNASTFYIFSKQVPTISATYGLNLESIGPAVAEKTLHEVVGKNSKVWWPSWNTIIGETSKFRRREDSPRDQLWFASSPESIRALVPEIMILACFLLFSTNQNAAKSQVPQNPTSVFSWWMPPPKSGVVCLMRSLFFFNHLKIHLLWNLPFWFFFLNGRP